MNSGSTSNTGRNRKMFRFLSYALVFLMMACVVMTVGSLIQNILPDWHSGIIAGILILIVMDRLYTYRHLKSLTPFSSEWVIALGGQWVLIVLLIRFLLSYANGLDAFVTDLSLFTRGSLGELFTPEFVVSVFLAILVWVLPGQFLDLLDEIGLNQKLASRQESMPIQRDAVPVHQRMVNLIFSLGLGLVILTALSILDLRSMVSNLDGIPSVESERLSGGEAGALLYFAFGLALLSLSRLMSLQTRWVQQQIPVSSDNLVRQWGMYSLIFLLVLAMFVSLLPAGDSLGLFSLLGALFGFLLSILFFIGQLLLALILLLFSLPMLLLRGGPPPMNFPAAPPLPSLPPVDPAVPMNGNETWMLIRSILLWAALVVIVVFAFIQFVRQHGGLRAALRKSRVTNWLILAWQWLYRNADQTREKLSRAIAEGWQSIVSRLEGKRILPPVGLISLRSLDPRRRIYFFYFAMIRRGDEQGLTRKPSQTPTEYAVTLEKALPTAREDIDSITEAFVLARYSRQDVDSGKAELVKATWARIRGALQTKSKGEKSANK